MGTSNTENDFMRINFVTEIDIVHFISVTLIHVSSQDQIKNCLRCEYTELS
jgi:hypothetical protein